MSFETLKWFWKFYLKNILKTSHILFNIPCALFIVENYIIQKIFRRDIKLFLIGGENEFSVLFKITYSILVFWIIQVILKGGEIVLNFYILSNFSYILFLSKYFQIILTYVISYVFLKYFWKIKGVNPIFKMFSIFRIHTL